MPAPWEWEAIGFNEHADHTDAILRCLAADDPVDELSVLWPWLPLSRRKEFVEAAVPLQNSGSSDLEVLVERFDHVIRAEWADRYAQPPRQPLLRRLRRWWSR